MTADSLTVYLSHRAGDADQEVEQLRLGLVARAGDAAVQVGSRRPGVPPGSSGLETDLAHLSRVAVVLVVVGPKWLEPRDPQGRSALSSPADPVRAELLAAIERRLPMLVVLVRGARMVRAADLPPELTPIAQKPSVEIHPSRWEFDVAALVELVKPLLGSRGLRAAATGSARSAPMPLDVAQGLRERASRLAPGGDRTRTSVSRFTWVLAPAVLALVGVAGWWAVGGFAPSTPSGAPAATTLPGSSSPLQAALENLARAQSDATVAAAVARAAARAADAAAATPMPAETPPADRARWQSDVSRLRAEAQAAEQRAAELAQRAAEAQAALEALRRLGPGGSAGGSPAPAAAPQRPAAPAPAPPPAARPAAPSPAGGTAPTTAAPAPAERSLSASPPPGPPGPRGAVGSEPSTLTLANWAIATSSGCGAGELRAVGTAEITIVRTADGVLLSQTFQGTAGAWRLSTSGSATFPAPRATYEFESSGLWTRDGARPFRSISRITVNARDGGLVPASARGSQYRTECPGG